MLSQVRLEAFRPPAAVGPERPELVRLEQGRLVASVHPAVRQQVVLAPDWLGRLPRVVRPAVAVADQEDAAVVGQTQSTR